MAKLLGECLTKQFQMLREVNPKVDVWVWSDMLDPHHNAHGNYYLVVAHWQEPSESGSLGGKEYKSTKYSATLTVLTPQVCPCCGE